MFPWHGANLLQALMQALQPGVVASQLHLGWKSLPSPWLKAWPQLFNISMKPVKGYRYVKWPCQRLVAQLLLYKTALNGPAPCVPSPSSDLWGWGHPIYIFLIFPGHVEFWTPLQIPIWGPPSWLHPVTILSSNFSHFSSWGTSLIFQVKYFISMFCEEILIFHQNSSRLQILHDILIH